MVGRGRGNQSISWYIKIICNSNFCVHQVFLTHSHTHLFLYCLPMSSCHTERRPTNPFTIWPYRKCVPVPALDDWSWAVRNFLKIFYIQSIHTFKRETKHRRNFRMIMKYPQAALRRKPRVINSRFSILPIVSSPRDFSWTIYECTRALQSRSLLLSCFSRCSYLCQ